MNSKRRYKWLLIVAMLAIRYLYAQNPQFVAPLGHTDRIVAAEFSSNNRYLLTTSYDNTYKVWLNPEGTLLYTFQARNSNYAHFSPDNNCLYYGLDSFIIFKDFRRDTVVCRLNVKGAYYDYAMSPDGKYLMVRSLSGISIWNLSDLSCTSRYAVKRSKKACWSPLGESILVDCGGRIVVWSWHSNETTFLNASDLGESLEVKYSRDSLWLMGYSDSELLLWDAKTLGKIITIDIAEKLGKAARVRGLDISTNGKYLLVNAWDSMFICNALSGEVIVKRLVNRPDWILFNSDDSRVLVGDYYGGCGSYKAEDLSVERSFSNAQRYREQTVNYSFSHDRSYLMLEYDNTSVIVLDPRSGKVLYKTLGELESCSTQINHNGTVAITTGGRLSCFWDLKSGVLLQALDISQWQFATFKWCSEGEAFLVIDTAGNINVGNALRGSKMKQIRLPESLRATQALFSKTGTYIIVMVAGQNRVWIYNNATSVLFATLPNSESVKDCFETNQDDTFIAELNNLDVVLWQISNQKNTTILNEISQDILEPRINRSNTLLSTLTSDGTGHIWDIVNAESLYTRKVAVPPGNPLEFSHGDQYLLQVENERSVVILEPRTGAIIQHLQIGKAVRFSCFSSDGNYLVIVTADQRVEVRATQNWAVLYSIDDYYGKVTAVSFNSDKQWLIVNYGKVVSVYELISGAKRGSRVFYQSDCYVDLDKNQHVYPSQEALKSVYFVDEDGVAYLNKSKSLSRLMIPYFWGK